MARPSHPSPTPVKETRKRSRWRWVVGVVGVVAVLAFVVTALAALFPPIRNVVGNVVDNVVGNVARPRTSRPFQVVGPSMEPTYRSGQTVLVQDYASTSTDPQRGDVVIFYPPETAHLSSLKRVVGLPGERVRLDAQGAVTINGAPLHEPYVKTGGNPDGVIAVTLGPGEYFLLGDNRPNSLDSRNFGPIPRAHIVGKVVGVVGS